MKNLTLSELARQLEMPKSTVSYALRNHPRVSEDTCKKVQEQARRLGYQPNPRLAKVLSEVKQHHGEVIAVLNPMPVRLKQVDSEHSHLAYCRHIKELCQEKGYDVQEFAPEPSQIPFKRMLNIFRERGIKGVIMTRSQSGAVFDELFEDFSVVSIGTTNQNPNIDAVEPHNYLNFNRIFMECKKRGYSHVGLVYNEDVSLQFNLAMHGNVSYLQSTESMRFSIQTSTEKTFLNERDRFLSWFKKTQPDVVVAGNQIYGNWLVESGVKIPETIGFCVIYNYEGSDYSGIYMNPRVVAKACVDEIVTRMNDPRKVDRAHEHVLVEGEFMDMGSLPLK